MCIFFIRTQFSVGITMVLDEPTNWNHKRDHYRMMDTEILSEYPAEW